MIRIGLSLILVSVLAGCTNTSPGESITTPIVIEPTIIQPTVTTETSSESPVDENSLSPKKYTIQEYPVPAGFHPHDVAPAPDGSVWYTAQISGALDTLDPSTGETRPVPLGSGSSPHGVIVGPDGAPWITDSGLNAIVRVDPQTEEVQKFPLPDESGYANLNTAAFDPTSKTFTSFKLPSPDAAVRQILGRPGEIWGAESALDEIVVIRIQ